MSAVESALSWYLQVHILLAVSYALFRLQQAVSPRFLPAPSSGSAMRTAQALVMASVLIPAALAFTPPGRVQRRLLAQGPPPSEGAGASLGKPAGPGPQSALPELARTARGRSLELANLLAEAKPVLLPAAVLLFLAGVGLTTLRLLTTMNQLNRLIAEGVAIRRVGRVLVIVSDAVAVPMSTLVSFRAVIVVPPSILASAADLRIAIRHELQHHRQRDTAWAIGIELLVCLCFANPAIYLWRWHIIELQELCCDEVLIRRKGVSSQDYGRCLLRVAEAALGRRQPLVGTACMAVSSAHPHDFKSFLRRRIEMFSHYKVSPRTRAGAITMGAVCLLATAAVACGVQRSLRPSVARQPNPGRAVFDPTVQGIAERVLRAAVTAEGAKAGFVLVSDPASGRLLAAANVTEDPRKQGQAWSLSYLLEPASAMKGLTLAAAVDRGVTTFDERFSCENGDYRYGPNVVHDWKPFASLSTTDTVVQSSNICGIKIGERLGVAGLSKMLSDFGFGVGGSSEGFPEAAPGDVPQPSEVSPEEYVILAATGGLLQGQFAVTPLEMVQAYGAIANGGKLMRALLADQPDSAASVVRQVIAPSTAEGMKAVLAKVVTDGTGKPARSALYTTAGKTSSAYVPGTPENDGLGGERAMAGFVGFAPVDKPRLIIYVGIIDPTHTAEHEPNGSQQAAPVFRQVAELALQSLNVAPDRL